MTCRSTCEVVTARVAPCCDAVQEPSRATAPAAAPGGQQPDELELDDDELLDMMGDMQPEPRPQPMLPSSMGPPLTDTLPGEHCAARQPVYCQTHADGVC